LEVGSGAEEGVVGSCPGALAVGGNSAEDAANTNGLKGATETLGQIIVRKGAQEAFLHCGPIRELTDGWDGLELESAALAKDSDVGTFRITGDVAIREFTKEGEFVRAPVADGRRGRLAERQEGARTSAAGPCAVGCDELWLNPGTESPEVLAEAERLGLNVVQACSIVGLGLSPSQL
jgi:hypothetical protein